MSHHWLEPNWEPLLSLPELPIEHFINKGIKALILDADKTLLHNTQTIPENSVKEWINKAKENFILHILSNNPSKNRISKIAEELDLPYTYLAAKPRRYCIRRVIRKLSINENNIAIIGDRIFTDVLGGNRMGLYTVLVKPIESNGNHSQGTNMQNLEKNLARILGAKI
tara:strand:+ start:126 stop:632 length:507 start_codon:yes stop_codon:yes gene_type:complete